MDRIAYFWSTDNSLIENDFLRKQVIWNLIQPKIAKLIKLRLS